MQPIDTTLDSRRLRRSAAEEIANTTTHVVGLLLSLLGGVVLVSAARYAGVGLVVACAAYITTVISMYAVSALSHASLGRADLDVDVTVPHRDKGIHRGGDAGGDVLDLETIDRP